MPQAIYLTVQCSTPEPTFTKLATNSPEIRETGMVLLVDDDRIFLEITGAMLARLGFTVLVAVDGVEAVEVFRRQKDEIRLVLSDLAMPRMNGWETLLALRQIMPGIPVILASGYSEEQVMKETHLERPQAFLGKPFGLQALSDTIRQTLGGTKG
jgi:two-component system, cell cycle sensor histidine kinase and response regulator CckA